jgi:hypothetical protein
MADCGINMIIVIGVLLFGGNHNRKMAVSVSLE